VVGYEQLKGSADFTGESATALHGAPDKTATGKEHFEVLDGLRGTAALLVVLFHIQGITVDWQGSKVFLHHGGRGRAQW
jgi:hypothetical protein